MPVLACLALLLLLPLPRPVAAQGSELAEAVKAAYLPKFAPFVEWPAGALDSGPFAICIVGEDPFGDLLDRAIAAQAIAERPIEVRRLRALPGENICHILFAAGAPALTVPRILDAVRGRPVLTITDSATEAAAKGVINLLKIDNRIRFEIDIAAAAQNRLSISSKLLSLAVPRQRN
jgi:hypothetical protein